MTTGKEASEKKELCASCKDLRIASFILALGLLVLLLQSQFYLRKSRREYMAHLQEDKVWLDEINKKLDQKLIDLGVVIP